MKKTVPLTIVIALAIVCMGSGIDLQAPPAPGVASRIVADAAQAGFAENPAAGRVREVTAYNVGVRGQTNDDPCTGATGEDLCRLVTKGLKICAANFVEPKAILNIEGYGDCIVLDRMNPRFAHRVDIAMGRDEVDRALEFGIQRRHVRVKTSGP